MTNKKSSSSESSHSVAAVAVSAAVVDSDALRDLLGYLNFSQGAARARFRGTLNELFREPQRALSPVVLRDFLLTELFRLSKSGDAACADPTQAEKPA